VENLEVQAVRSVAEQVHKTLVRAIVEGTFAPNERLSDRHLSEKLGVSRTPVREAFHLLEAAGLVKRRSRIGWIVADFNQRDVEELFELRAVLEATGIKRAVAWNDADLSELAGHFDDFQLPLPPGDTTAYLKRDNEFHKALVAGTENGRMVDIYRIVEWQIDRVRHFVSYRAHGRIRQSLEEHRLITRALRERDEESAVRALNRHLSNVQARFVELMSRSDAKTSVPGEVSQ
jgi:DNA-binding GntR family transcriptional regulator